MKYYLIAGEASGDLHAAHLMAALRKEDSEAQFRFFGGDKMQEEGGTMVAHYSQLAFMGFIPVLLHLPTILRYLRLCKQDIVAWQPDVVILVDYPGFNLKVAAFVRQHTDIPVFYYIAPKLWAWKEYRIKNIRRDVDELFSILPFEKAFFEGKHHYPIHYVGNPTADEVTDFLASYPNTDNTFQQSLDDGKASLPIIALLAGSRRQEIKDNLPAMLKATLPMTDDYRIIVAGAPNIDSDFYRKIIGDLPVEIVHGRTYELLANATAALVTSGTATLETALFGVPQVVCYKTPLPHLISFLRRHLIKVPYISLVNLIADSEVVTELVAHTFTLDNIRNELSSILPGGNRRSEMLEGYEKVRQAIGQPGAPANAARKMVNLLRKSSC
ncbi:MAG: lipid-A-disaccharide synthase [Prevotella sp.]|nr:lipid-A-disaccharide synthase [Prevotella sp.]MCI5855507.1 lipid-A-disaccharide synthase [Prevotella sp.]